MSSDLIEFSFSGTYYDKTVNTRFPKVFEDGDGSLAGEHHINFDVTVDGVPHVPCITACTVERLF